MDGVQTLKELTKLWMVLIASSQQVSNGKAHGKAASQQCYEWRSQPQVGKGCSNAAKLTDQVKGRQSSGQWSCRVNNRSRKGQQSFTVHKYSKMCLVKGEKAPSVVQRRSACLVKGRKKLRDNQLHVLLSLVKVCTSGQSQQHLFSASGGLHWYHVSSFIFLLGKGQARLHDRVCLTVQPLLRIFFSCRLWLTDHRRKAAASQKSRRFPTTQRYLE